jgi:hypothetical protein
MITRLNSGSWLRFASRIFDIGGSLSLAYSIDPDPSLAGGCFLGGICQASPCVCAEGERRAAAEECRGEQVFSPIACRHCVG